MFAAEGDDTVVVSICPSCCGPARSRRLHSRKTDDDTGLAPPSFEDFRSTIELLDRRSKAFIQQTTDVVGELRRFGQSVKRINRERSIVICIVIGMGALVGALIHRLL